MIQRLEQGRHPDTDPTFWHGYKGSPAPILATKPDDKAYDARPWSRRELLRLGVGLVSLITLGSIVISRSISWLHGGRRRADQVWASSKDSGAGPG
jgi:hypothetical protein